MGQESSDENMSKEDSGCFTVQLAFELNTATDGYTGILFEASPWCESFHFNSVTINIWEKNKIKTKTAGFLV